MDDVPMTADELARMKAEALASPDAWWAPGRLALIDALEKAQDKWHRLDCDTGKIDALVAMRSDIFTGEPPYVGWTGIHDALNAEFDEKNKFRAERDAARAELENAQREELCPDCQTVHDQLRTRLAEVEAERDAAHALLRYVAELSPPDIRAHIFKFLEPCP